MRKIILGLALVAVALQSSHAEIRRQSWPGGMYGECQPDGRFAVWLPDRIETHAGPIALPAQSILHHRLSPVGATIAGQAGFGDGQYVVWDGASWSVSPERVTYGVSVVAFWPDGRLEVSMPEKGYGSQGIRYIADRVYTGDETYGDPVLKLSEFTRQGDIAVGQGSHNGGVTLVRGSTRKRLHDGLDYFVRFNRKGDALCVAWWEKVGASTTAHRVALLESDIPSLPDDVLPPDAPPVPPPAPAPSPAPQPQIPPVPDYAPELEQIRNELHPDYIGRALPGPPEGPRMALLVLKVFAWRHRSEGFGIFRAKPGSANNVEGYTGDVVGFANGRHWDTYRDGGFVLWNEHGPGDWPAMEPRWEAVTSNPLGGAPDPPKPPPSTDPKLAALEKKLVEAEIALAQKTVELRQMAERAVTAEAAADHLRADVAQLTAERDKALNDLAVEKAKPIECRAKVPGWLGFLRIGCEVVR